MKTVDSLNISSASVALSGCKILVDNDKIIKISSSLSYNQRLLKQIEKQYFFFKNFNLKGIKTPHIFNISTDNEYSFSMEKINGADWEEFFNYSGPKQINLFLETVVNYLKHLKSTSVLTVSDEKILAKLVNLEDKSEYKTLIETLKTKLSSIPIPTSFCHGDLTLSNILFLKNEVYFIDFLDSFVNSYWIDLIKLRQDIKYKFCLRHSNINSLRLINTFNSLNTILEDEFFDEIKNPIFKILETLNYLRIEPYISKDKSIILREILNEEELNHTNLR